MMRPRPTRWFELLVARDDTTLALEALASTGSVELETRHDEAMPGSYAALAPAMARVQALAQRYHAWWPHDGLQPSTVPEEPAQTVQRSLMQLQAWAAEAEPQILRLQQAQDALQAVAHWRAVAARLAGGPLTPSRLAGAGATLKLRLAVLAPAALAGWQAWTTEAGTDAPLWLAASEPDALRVLLLGTPAQLQRLTPVVHQLQGRMLEPPSWLADARPPVDELERAVAGATQALDALADRHGLRRVLADLQRLQWVLDNVHGLEAGTLLCWITGWTAVDDERALVQAIEHSGVRALLRQAEPPPGKRAPLRLVNPAWAQPFEVFCRAMGMPDAREADPSVLLALAVPLMFGYMFGDVGQGLVIAAGGFALRGRFAMARLFVAGGLSAAVFGLLFGSVFGLHVLPALWIAPLQDPLAVLVVPVAAGAVLLGLGLGLDALAAHWRGEAGRWWAGDAGFVACWIALLASLRWPAALAVAGAGAVAGIAGHALHQRRVAALAGALGEFVERLLQLLIHTLSFARVGAFALAHAGLSSALVALADAAGHPVAALAVLVVGNIVVIALEGLVVSIQTTRLVLFEFFARFLRGTGRVFRPLPLPPSMLQENPR